MSTITKELAKLFRKITNSEIDAEGNAHVVLSPADSLLINNARIALASLEAEPVAWAHRLINKRNGVVHPWVYGSAEACPSEGDIFNIEVMPLYTVHPAPVSVPAAMEMDDDFDSAFEHGKAVGWNACRAAMLQGAEHVTTACKLPGDFESFISWLTSGDGIPSWLINGDKLDDEKVSFLLKVYRAGSQDANGKTDEGIFVSKSSEMSVSDITINVVKGGESRCSNSPVIPECSCRTCRPVTISDMRFVVCPECGNKRCPHANDHLNACTGSNEPGQEGSAYPATPQQEVK
ncbi:hypothetical protein ACNQ05_24250 [Enterobacter cloacae complex sp.6701062]|uniref:hypothetical protein n=1 Tax=unclassified Enterobacter cloacae complex TaxID=2757714 RepID=UPI003AAE6A5F